MSDDRCSGFMVVDGARLQCLLPADHLYPCACVGVPDRTVTPDDYRRAAGYLRRVPARGDQEAADLVRLVELFEKEGKR